MADQSVTPSEWRIRQEIRAAIRAVAAVACAAIAATQPWDHFGAQFVWTLFTALWLLAWLNARPPLSHDCPTTREDA